MKIKIKFHISVLLLFFGGLLLGGGVFTFFYAKGYSYLSDNPNACINCHIMRENMDSWIQSTHHHVAKCNDCHLPHNIVGKYAVKALNGFNHSAAFTLQNFKDPILIKKHSLDVVKASCMSCHQAMIKGMEQPKKHTQDHLNCLDCHRNVGHAN